MADEITVHVFQNSLTKSSGCDYCGYGRSHVVHSAVDCPPPESYLNNPELSRELIEYLGNHKDAGQRPYTDLEQEFWRFRTGKLLESDLMAPGASDSKPDTSLSLLVIDLQTSCVVKVERGEYDIYTGHEIAPAIYDPVREGQSVTDHRPFTELRNAIDGDKPVPRIEKNLPCNKPYTGIYQLITSEDDEAKMHTLYQHEIDALSELAGKPLPIYTPTEGKWERIGRQVQGHGPVFDLSDDLPVKIWRYTRS